MDKESVLVVHNYYQISGGEDTVVANERKLLENNGHKVVFYSRDNSELLKMSMLKKILLPFTFIFNPRTYLDIRKIIKKENIQIVHVHNTLSLISPSVYYAAHSLKIPIIQTVHNFRFVCPNGLLYRSGHICEDCLNYGLKCSIKNKCYRNSRIQTIACVISNKIHQKSGIYKRIKFICLTEFNKRKMLTVKSIEPKNIYIKPNFVDREKLPIIEGERLNQFVFAGRLDKLKGIDVLFEAWKLLDTKETKLVVCGTGPMERWCQRFIIENDVNIELKGFISNQEVLEIVAKSKGLILPTQLYEGFPMSIVEAFSVGTPVLCSDLGNAGDLVKNGLTGYKFNPNKPLEIAQAVSNCYGMCEDTFEEYQMKYKSNINYQTLKNIYDLAKYE